MSNITFPAPFVTKEEKRRLRIAAAWEGVSMSEFIRRAVRDRIDEIAPGLQADGIALEEGEDKDE